MADCGKHQCWSRWQNLWLFGSFAARKLGAKCVRWHVYRAVKATVMTSSVFFLFSPLRLMIFSLRSDLGVVVALSLGAHNLFDWSWNCGTVSAKNLLDKSLEFSCWCGCKDVFSLKFKFNLNFNEERFPYLFIKCWKFWLCQIFNKNNQEHKIVCYPVRKKWWLPNDFSKWKSVFFILASTHWWVLYIATSCKKFLSSIRYTIM